MGIDSEICGDCGERFIRGEGHGLVVAYCEDCLPDKVELPTGFAKKVAIEKQWVVRALNGGIQNRDHRIAWYIYLKMAEWNGKVKLSPALLEEWIEEMDNISRPVILATLDAAFWTKAIDE